MEVKTKLKCFKPINEFEIKQLLKSFSIKKQFITLLEHDNQWSELYPLKMENVSDLIFLQYNLPLCP